MNELGSIEVADLFDWLPTVAGHGPVVACLPDAEEIGSSVAVWRPWYRSALAACEDASSGAVVVICTDRKSGGRWESKASHAITEMSLPLRWHRIALKQAAGTTNLHRPTYTHLLAFGGKGPGPGKPDVLAPSAVLWKNGVPLSAAEAVLEWLNYAAPNGPVLVPCAGHGTLPLAAAASGRKFLGCDIDPNSPTLTAELIRSRTDLAGAVKLF